MKIEINRKWFIQIKEIKIKRDPKTYFSKLRIAEDKVEKIKIF
jgi:hypothetical protein